MIITRVHAALTWFVLQSTINSTYFKVGIYARVATRSLSNRRQRASRGVVLPDQGLEWVRLPGMADRNDQEYVLFLNQDNVHG